MKSNSVFKQTKNIEYSVIISCYYEEYSINEFYSRLSDTLKKSERTYEIIFTNDGSNDGTWDELKNIYENDNNVTSIIDFFRNFGQRIAMTASITQARGNNFIFMDSDLQLDPEEIIAFMDEFEKGYDIVTGYRKNRKDSLFRKISSKFANIFMRKVAGHDLSDFGCTFQIMRGKLIRGFEFGPFKKFNTAYVFARAGRVKELIVNHHERKYGVSGWTKKKLFAFYMENLIGVFHKPFQSIYFLCFGGAFFFMLRLILELFFPFKILTSVTNGLILNMVIINLFVVLAVLSIIGEYILRNFYEIQNFPHYVIKEIHTKDIEIC